MPWTEEQRREQGERMRLAWRDPIRRERLRLGAIKGGQACPRGEAYRQAMSRAKRGEVRSPETRLKMSRAKLGTKHSEEHRRKNSEARKGVSKGPHSSERIWNQRFGFLVRAMTNGGYKSWMKYPQDRRNGGGMRAWRRAVIVREGRACIGCGSEPKRIEIHHLLSWARFLELRFDPENGVPLCMRCHNTANAFQRRLENLLWPEPQQAQLRLVRTA